MGYTNYPDKAGEYTLEEAQKICKGANEYSDEIQEFFYPVFKVTEFDTGPIEESGDKIIKIAGITFRCDCGCNVFRQIVGTNKYKCNSCREIFTGTPLEVNDVCADGVLPDGPECPKCGKPRAPSGIDGGTWVHVKPDEEFEETSLEAFREGRFKTTAERLKEIEEKLQRLLREGE